MIPRTEMDIAVVGCGVSLTLKGGVCTAARVGLGAVAPTVLLVEAGGEGADRQPISKPRRSMPRPPPAAPPAVRSTTSAAPSLYRTKIAGVLLKRTAAIAAKRAGGN